MHERTVAALGARLGQEELEREVAAGRAMTTEDAVAYALASSEPASSS
jgi:hypothetical protein